MDQIKELREISGAGMVDCKNALEESAGDVKKALELLRKKGIAKAAKREGREANEGIIKVDADSASQKAFIAEFNAETDFVVRSEKFQEFCEETFSIIKCLDSADMEVLMESKMSDGNTVKENLETLSGVIGEKLAIKRFEIMKTRGSAAAYSHLGGRIGAVISLDKADSSGLAYEIAMQVAAANPKYITSQDVDPSELAKEKEIYAEQLKKEGKPENMMDKIIEGKLKKFFEEVCLEEQEYIKDDKKRVKDILEGSRIEKFVRYSL